jgi:pimeloyl-ACP methyl ester carboxylesterase
MTALLCFRAISCWSTALVALSLVTGCASQDWVTVRKTPKNPLSEQLNLFARGGPKPTERTRLLLRKYALDEDEDPATLSDKLKDVVDREPAAETLYSLAELSYIGAKKSEALNSKKALELYGAAVVHAYLYLFQERYDSTRNPYDPEFRGACDLYNSALEGTLRIVSKQGGLLPGRTHVIQTPNRQIDLTIAVRGNSWHPEDLERFEFASDFEVTGLRNIYHGYGLGVPLIAVRKPRPADSPLERFYPPALSFPITAFLRLDQQRSAGDRHAAVLELYDPLVDSDVLVGRRRSPLECDLSTPLAYCLNQKELREFDYSTVGLLRPEKTTQAKGLYMLEPYRPGKIPVLMVHGIWSSPITWMEMFNDLRAAPEIRDHYQFWFYLYPSGQPFWYSAAQLRDDLARMRAVIDPMRRDQALDQMVLVGHSMGGLVAKLQTVSSGNEFWKIVSDKPFGEVKASAEERQRLASVFFFEPNPSVRRVITIGTPHRGSSFANDTTRYLGSKLIKLPQMLVNSQQQLLRDNPDLFRDSRLIEIPTSIDSLAPDSPILPVLLTARRPPTVYFHNIVGRVPKRSLIGRVVSDSDGIVTVESAHLDDVASEIEVPADHLSIHRHPRSVYEVRRILLEHLHELRFAPSPLERLPITADASARIHAELPRPTPRAYLAPGPPGLPPSRL